MLPTYHFPGMLYAVPVGSTIANGEIETAGYERRGKNARRPRVFHRDNIGKLFRVAVSFGDDMSQGG